MPSIAHPEPTGEQQLPGHRRKNGRHLTRVIVFRDWNSEGSEPPTAPIKLNSWDVFAPLKSTLHCIPYARSTDIGFRACRV